MKSLRIAIVGATGLVGTTVLKILEERNFPIATLLPVASEKSIGKFIKYGGEDTELAIRLYEIYPRGLYYFKTLISYHHGKKELDDYCEDMKIYGSINLHKLINKYPQHANHLSGRWLTSIYGYLVFNRLVMCFIHYILMFINMRVLIKYKIAYSVISGYRLNK